MKQKKETAIEWLVENAQDFLGGLICPSIIIQAMDMERKQIRSAFKAGRRSNPTGDLTIVRHNGKSEVVSISSAYYKKHYQK